jgi:hypothetical protein
MDEFQTKGPKNRKKSPVLNEF